MNSYRVTHLNQLESEAIFILRETAAQFEKPGLLFSGGKDSIVMAHLARKAPRAHQHQRLRTAESCPQQLVESGEVVHVSVRHKNHPRLQVLARRQGSQWGQIKKQRSARVGQFHVKPRIAKGRMDQAGTESVTHDGTTSRVQSSDPRP